MQWINFCVLLHVSALLLLKCVVKHNFQDSSSKFVLSGTSDSSTIQLKDGESLDFEESPVVKETLYAAVSE